MLLAEDNLDAARADDTTQRCSDYLVELLRQLRQRLPSDVELLENLASLSRLADVSFVRFYSGRVGDLEQEWARIGTVNWTTQQDTEDFSIEVVTHTGASGEQDFQHLGEQSCRLLISVLMSI